MPAREPRDIEVAILFGIEEKLGVFDQRPIGKTARHEGLQRLRTPS